MSIRWVDSPQPEPLELALVDQKGALRISNAAAFQINVDGQPRTLSFPIEPIMGLALDPTKGIVRDPLRLTARSTIDVYPGDAKLLDVAVKFVDATDVCYGWNNRSFSCSPKYRNSEWQIPIGNYLVEVLVRAAGEEARGIFRLVNASSLKDFRLESSTQDERKRVADSHARERERVRATKAMQTR
jgi:hypothetical protein